MDVSFERTGRRQYAIVAAPDRGPLMHLPKAPGFDPWLPHDLAHFLVERHFAIRGGIFGQVAAGGDAGTFTRLPRTKRDARADRARSVRLSRLGRADVARSERLAGAATAAWFDHRGAPWPHAASVDPDDLGSEASALLEVIDREAERWHDLPSGRPLQLHWPTDLRPLLHPAAGSRHQRSR